MMKATRGKRIDTIFVLIIFCIFAVSVLIVLMLGAGIYRNMNDISNDGRDERTALSYLWTKVKNNDTAGNVYVGDFCGLPALCIDEEDDGTAYQTVVYHYDGWICELFYEVGIDFTPDSGSKILEVADLKLETLDQGLIKASCGDYTLLISPRSGTAQIGAVSAERGLPG